MGKHGMKERVTKNPDPTFSEVLGIFRKETREIKEKQKAADAFACLKAVRFYLRGNGFELADDLAIRDVYTKRVFRSMVPVSKLAPRPKERC